VVGIGSDSSVTLIYQGQHWSNLVGGMFPDYFTEGLDEERHNGRHNNSGKHDIDGI
jgi:hypothetical protein